MEKLETISAVAIPLDSDNIDTDQIFPARFMSKPREAGHYGTYFFYDQRFDENGKEKPGSILNDQRLADAKIIVAGRNYAFGSARAGSLTSHLDFGIRIIIAESFGPVFPAVAYKSGILTIVLPTSAVAALRNEVFEHLGSQVTVDVCKQVIVSPSGLQFSFELDHFVKRLFLEGLSEIELTFGYRRQIESFEEKHRALLPWVFDPDS